MQYFEGDHNDHREAFRAADDGVNTFKVQEGCCADDGVNTFTVLCTLRRRRLEVDCDADENF